MTLYYNILIYDINNYKYIEYIWNMRVRNRTSHSIRDRPLAHTTPLTQLHSPPLTSHTSHTSQRLQLRVTPLHSHHSTHTTPLTSHTSQRLQLRVTRLHSHNSTQTTPLRQLHSPPTPPTPRSAFNCVSHDSTHTTPLTQLHSHNSTHLPHLPHLAAPSTACHTTPLTQLHSHPTPRSAFNCV